MESVTHDDASEFHVRLAADEDRSLAVTVVETTAAMARAAPRELEPLADAVDPESLDRVADLASRPACEHVSVSFSYAGYRIEISGSRRITVTEHTCHS